MNSDAPEGLSAGADAGGGGRTKIGENMIFYTKYPKNVRASLRSVQFFYVRPPLTWNPGSAPDQLISMDIGTSRKSNKDGYYDVNESEWVIVV